MINTNKTISLSGIYSQPIQNDLNENRPFNPSTKSPSKVWRMTSSISSFVTLDRLAKASIAACAIVGGGIALSNPKIQTVFNGMTAAAMGSAAICTLWGGASLIKGRKTEGMRRLTIGTALFALGAGTLKLRNINENIVEKNPVPKSKIPTYVNGKKKEIRLATVTDNYNKEGNLNKDRQQITDLALENHGKYAKRWKLKHDIEAKSLVAGQCWDPQTKKMADCSPYWNKIKYFVNWCKQPSESSDKEEWAIYSDDDGIYTNLNIDPSEAIDRLRSGLDTSFIVSTEGPTTPYPESEGGDSRGSIKGPANTGVLIVRKDQKGCEVIEKIWENRNAPTTHIKPKSEKTNCPTYGLCNDQTNGDEQGALDKVLLEDAPQLVGTHATRVQPRDPSSPTRAEIAFNTVHRGGCTQAFKYDGTLLYPWDITNGDLAGNKEGIWRKGDWIGQTAGFPMHGIYYPDQKITCKPDPERKPQPIRIEKVREMLNQVEVDKNP